MIPGGFGLRLGLGMGPSGGFSGVLDGLTATAYAAHAFHLLTVDWKDSAVCRLREDATDTEDDFFASTSGVLTNGSGQTVAAWLTANSASNAFVDTLYDQTGNARPWTQTTNASQPTFSLTALNGDPAAVFAAASSQYMVGTNLHQVFSGSDTPYTMASTVQVTDLATARCFVHTGHSTEARATIYHGSVSVASGFLTNRRATGDGGSPISHVYTGDTDPYVHLWRHNGTTIDIFRDDVQVITAGAFNTGTVTVDTTHLGASRLGGAAVANFMEGVIADTILFDSAISTDDINKILS